MTCLEGLPEQSLFSVKRTQQHSWVCKNASGQGHLDIRGQSGDV